MAFAGGFMGGASQFAGDHFMMTQGQQEGGAGGDAGPKKSSRTETVRNVTIRQLIRDNANSDASVHTVDGIELQLMTLVGRIVKQECTAACITYTVHDGTGSLEGMTYVNDVSEEVLNKTRSDLRVGNYVRVFGVLRYGGPNNQLGFQSYKTRPVTDFNEITYHNLQVIFQRLHLKQGAPPQGGLVMPAAQGVMPLGQQGMGFMAAPAPAGTSSLFDQLIELYHRPDVVQNFPQGIHVSDVTSLLQQGGGNFSAQQVRDEVEKLVNEGQLYSTTDDDTHRMCG